MEDTLEVYIDGSCLPHPRRGGVGIRFVGVDDTSGEEVIEDLSPPGYRGATNQEMEILACTVALQVSLELALPGVRRLVIWTDSDYLFSNYRKAIFEWPKQDWCGRSGAPVENAEDWKEFARSYKKARQRFAVVRIDWARGKSNRHNKAAHNLAKESARNPLNKPRKVVHVRRKLTTESIDRGSVRMEGQQLRIRIIQSGILNVQKLWRCSYEVVSEDSPPYGKADVIICDKGIRLDAGHTYEVRVNDDNDNPRVVEVFQEIVPEENEGEEAAPSPDEGDARTEGGEVDSTPPRSTCP